LRPSPLAPRNGFWATTDRCSRGHPHNLTARSLRLETAFRSPTTTAPFREPPQWGQRSWPISSASIPELSNCPFGLSLPSSPPFLAARGDDQCSRPVAVFLSRYSWTSSSFRSPSGLSSLRIVALNQRLHPRRLPLRSARFPIARRRVTADTHQRPTRRFRPLHGAA